MNEIEERRAANRAAYPAVAAIVDEFQAVFGSVQVLAGEDYTTGKSFGDTAALGMEQRVCDACRGDGAACARADRAVVYCRFRRAQEVGHCVQLWRDGARIR